MDEAWLALAGTLFGGAGFKIIEAILGRSKNKDTTATELRGELRGELLELRKESDAARKEADALRDEIDEWRTKYYSLVASIAKGDLPEALRKITER